MRGGKLKQVISDGKGITLFTIGFAKKTAEEFFTILRKNNVKSVIDVRLNNVSQLAGFTKRDDLKYFLECFFNIDYYHRPEFAPTKEILDAYKKKEISWHEYEIKYSSILKNRDIGSQIQADDLDMACLLCSEPTADKCHRRLLAEYINSCFGGISIKHL